MTSSLETFLWIFLPILIISDVFLLSVVRNSAIYNIMLISNSATAFAFWSCYSKDPARDQLPDATMTFYLTFPLLVCHDLIEYFFATSRAELVCAGVTNAGWLVACYSHFAKGGVVEEVQKKHVVEDEKKH